jgi:hypothetical protein
MSDFGTVVLFVFAKFNFSAMFPTEDDSLGINNDQFARNESGILKFHLGNLAFATHCSQICPPRDCSGWHKVVPSDFDCFHLILLLHDPNDFVKMPGVMSDPLAFQI